MNRRSGPLAWLRHDSRWAIILLTLAYLTMALAYSVVNPLHEATDELRHYRFVRTIATSGRLPVQGQEPCRAQSHHPPLFYALGAGLTAWIDTGRDICDQPERNPFWAYRYWEVGRDNKNQYLHGPAETFPWRGEALAAHLLRGLNALLGAGVVILVWATGRRLWPKRPALALGSAAIVAFNPMFLYMAGAINNDVIAALSGAAAVYAAVRLVCEDAELSWRWGAALGLIYGLALLSKFNLAAILVVLELALLWVAWRHRQWRRWLVANALLVGVALLVAGWWFGRNMLLYGEPTGFQAVTELWGARDPAQSFGLAVSELPYAWTTLWGRFGFGQIPLPQRYYDVLLAVAAAGGLGAMVGFWRERAGARRMALLLLAAAIGVYFLVLFNYMLVSPAGPNGRFFFPALSALALLLFFGLQSWLDLLVGRVRALGRRRRSAALAALVNVAFFALSLTALFGFLAPAYARPPAWPAGVSVPNPMGARFDGLVTLLGYELTPREVSPGGVLEVRLFWEVDARPPGDYLLFLHLIDEAGTMVAQRDTHPGLGNFPASQWRPGDRFVETIRLHLPQTAYAPADAGLSIGLYAPEGYRLGVTSSEGQPLGDALTLDQITVSPRPGMVPNPQAVNFGHRLMLTGYQFGSRIIPAGGALPVTLYWELPADMAADADIGAAVVQVSVLDQQGTLQAMVEVDGPSAAGTQTVQLELEPGLAPGRYDVDLAVLDRDSRQRLDIVASDGHLVDTHLSLAEVRIAP